MKSKLVLSTLISIMLQTYGFCQGPYAPAAGQPGSTAIYKDSTAFVQWATGCIVSQGYINISDTSYYYTQGNQTSNYAFYGSDSAATGYPDGLVVSLGDGGKADLSFEKPIINGPGYDFAVFENGMLGSPPSNEYYLELAFVEVSSDGINFVRFPAFSLTQDTNQTLTYGLTDPTNIHNLAGKYVVNYGTPFDLEDIKDSSQLNLNHITYIRIVDVVGSIDSAYARYDAQNHVINDPWPTPFWSSGFDLDAVGVIHSSMNSTEKISTNLNVSIFPNPIQANHILNIHLPFSYTKSKKINIIITDMTGSTLFETRIVHRNTCSFALNDKISPGCYIIHISTDQGNMFNKRLIVTE